MVEHWAANMTTKRIILIGTAALILMGGIVVGIWYLRNRDSGGPEPVLQTSTASPQTRAPAGGGLSDQDEKQIEQVQKLQTTLPADIRDTWTPEFRAQMEATKKIQH